MKDAKPLGIGLGPTAVVYRDGVVRKESADEISHGVTVVTVELIAQANFAGADARWPADHRARNRRKTVTPEPGSPGVPRSGSGPPFIAGPAGRRMWFIPGARFTGLLAVRL